MNAVGEEPPTFRSQTLLPDPTATEAVLKSLIAFPTPDDQLTPWDQLIDHKFIEDIQWETYQGTFQRRDKSTYWLYSFRYPADFYPSSQGRLNRGSVQNIAPTQIKPLPGAFIKFEVVARKDPPMIYDGEVIAPQNFHTVLIAGQPGGMRVTTEVPDQTGVFSTVFAYCGGWVAATGCINLPSTDSASLTRWTTVIFQILSTFEIQNQEAVKEGTSRTTWKPSWGALESGSS